MIQIIDYLRTDLCEYEFQEGSRENLDEIYSIKQEYALKKLSGERSKRRSYLKIYRRWQRRNMTKGFRIWKNEAAGAMGIKCLYA